MRVLVAGASGFIGTALVTALTDDGHEVVRLVRRRAHGADEAAWSPAAGIIDFTVMDRVDAVVNLSGASLARLPWSKSYRGEILESRITATRTLADAMRKARQPPTVFLSASAVGYYGDRPGELLTEYSSAGTGFLAEVVGRWEAAAGLAPEETRTVVFRSGMVVGHGGAMKRVGALTRLGVSARLGTGGQHWPWVALDDEVAAIVHLLGSSLSGPVNIAGPTPATADRVMSAMAERMHRPHALGVPERVLEVALGRAADELLLSSQKVRPQRLIDDGYRFRHATVESAIDAMLAAPRTSTR
ncbi:nucleoside-diphosphate sugar epimerase [Agromyces sp. Root1464]|uniref:TIGR01777 family oxidoreductase n=1 Tax=Agromyces sp. Root1464 TaxID=1736467 RepID=UPI0006FDADA8|nr:TIGR01777 family oxidoreductase [Agromyces sp. Root1464]KQZ07372.1 nucleoside-diphosphate sugar epimerase [Agromyces sp. Root1464]